ncbi:FkbM family methyltransferase [Szabonella alba]|uniref:FkbM family methyltransferase n=1 Tax=Szabonella alba TaxID=2804194 RepID=A0A8K0V721_9RHOB|nr:FkbM family methyltransferase [Szabonella alba]MBL4916346.1 FkbM family methyltransferase [Szabonella alba]
MAEGAKARLAWLAQRIAPARPLRIADVGANPLGKPPYLPLLRAGLAEVWGFEPDPLALARLDRTDPAVHVLPHAVGRGGVADFHAYPASEMSSLYPLSAAAIGYLGHFRRHLGTETRSRIETHRLDDMDDLPRLDLLKMDAQGAELAVLEGARDRLTGAVAVVTEMRFYQLYDGEPALWELDRALREQGFVLHRFLHQKTRMLHHSQRARVDARAIGSQLIDGDAVYIRRFEDRAAWDDAQIAALALLACGVFGSEDLVLLCLDELAARGRVKPKVAAAYADMLPQAVPA